LSVLEGVGFMGFMGYPCNEVLKPWNILFSSGISSFPFIPCFSLIPVQTNKKPLPSGKGFELLAEIYFNQLL
jgi:hypothetical protein